MEKKNFSKGLENISSVFLSSEKKTDGLYLDNGFSAVPKREETCASCTNMLEGSSGKPKCRIFTFENKKYGVTHLDAITLNHAHYCNHFAPISSEKNGTLKDVKDDFSYEGEDGPEIEETITSQKNIVYPDTEAAQQKMKAITLKYIESGYSIRSVELGKTAAIEGPNKKKCKEEILSFSIRKGDKS